MQNISDLINCFFQYGAGFVILRNIYLLYKHKEVKGVSKISTVFFTSMGIWGLFFYGINGFTLSFLASCFVTFCNIIWLIQMFYYSENKNKGGLYDRGTM